MVIAGATLGVTACEDDPAPAALHWLVGPTSERTICLPGGRGRDYTVGVDTAQNVGAEPVTVTGVELLDPDGIELLDASAIALGANAAVGEFGVWVGNPPRIPEQDGASARAWAHRVDAQGSTLDPDQEPETRTNFVLHLHGTTGATTGPIHVTYTDAAGDAGSWTSNVEYEVRDPC